MARVCVLSTFLGRGRGWTIVHSRSLAVGPRAWNALPADIRRAPLHPVWTLLRSVSNHICFLLLTIYNNFFNL